MYRRLLPRTRHKIRRLIYLTCAHYSSGLDEVDNAWNFLSFLVNRILDQSILGRQSTSVNVLALGFHETFNVLVTPHPLDLFEPADMIRNKMSVFAAWALNDYQAVFVRPFRELVRRAMTTPTSGASERQRETRLLRLRWPSELRRRRCCRCLITARRDGCEGSSWM